MNSPSDISMDFFSGNSTAPSQNDFLKAAFSGEKAKLVHQVNIPSLQGPQALSESSDGVAESSVHNPMAAGLVDNSMTENTSGYSMGVLAKPHQEGGTVSSLTCSFKNAERGALENPEQQTPGVFVDDGSVLSLKDACIVDSPNNSKSTKYLSQKGHTRDTDNLTTAVSRQAGIHCRLKDAESGLREMRRRMQESQKHFQNLANADHSQAGEDKHKNINCSGFLQSTPEEEHPGPNFNSPDRHKYLMQCAAAGCPTADERFDQPGWTNGYSGLKVEGLSNSTEGRKVDLFGRPLTESAVTGSPKRGSLTPTQTSTSIFRSPHSGRRPSKDQRNKWDPEKRKWIKPPRQQTTTKKETFLFNNDVLLRKQLDSFYNM